jgi:arsenite methyltransferase
MTRRALLHLSPLSLLLGCQKPTSPEPDYHLAPGYVVPRTVAPLFDPHLSALLLDEPTRDAWQRPQEIVAALNIQPTDTIADIGTGSGYLLPHFLKKLGPHGRLYAEEVQENYLPLLRKRAKGHPQVQIVLGTEIDPKLPSRNVDTFVLLTVYHEVQRPVFFLQKLRRYAKPGARLAIIDFDPTLKGKRHLPPEGHNVEANAVKKEAEAAGWKLEHTHTFLQDASQFFLVFKAL